MKKFAMLIALVSLLTWAAFAQKSSGNDKAAIEKMEKQYHDAIVKGDTAFLQKTLADDYVGVGGSGQEMSKAQVIDAMKSGKLKYESIDVKNSQVRVFGNTAVMNGEADVKAKMGDKDMSGTYRATRVWVKKNGQWQVESFQATKAQQPQQAESK